jgi:hypothetical protein
MECREVVFKTCLVLGSSSPPGYTPRDDLRPEATVPDWWRDPWAMHDAERGA